VLAFVREIARYIEHYTNEMKLFDSAVSTFYFLGARKDNVYDLLLKETRIRIYLILYNILAMD